MSDSQLYWSCKKSLEEESLKFGKEPVSIIVSPLHSALGPSKWFETSTVPDNNIIKGTVILERSASLPDFLSELKREHCIFSFQHSFYVISGDNHATLENDMDGTEDDLNAPSTSHGTGSTTSFPPSPPDLLGRQSAFDEYFVFGDVGPTPFKNYNAVEKIVINKKIDAAKEDENIKIIEKEVYRLHNEATHAYYNRFFETTISKLKIAEAFLNLAITCDYDQFDRIRKLILRTYICLADAYTESNQISQCILINQRINTEFSVDDVVRYKFVEFQVMTENLADSTAVERRV